MVQRMVQRIVQRMVAAAAGRHQDQSSTGGVVWSFPTNSLMSRVRAAKAVTKNSIGTGTGTGTTVPTRQPLQPLSES